MDLAGPTQPRVPRETRMLIATIVISIVSLWVLSRIRIAERDVPPSPVPPILTPLVRPAGFSDLASAVLDTHALIAPYVFTWPEDASADAANRGAVVPALQIGGALAVALIPTGFAPADDIAGRDHATGLTVIKTPGATMSAPPTWSPRQLQAPRYLFAATATAAGTSLRPLFVDALHPTDTPLWPTTVWTMRADAGATPGMLLFTADGSFAGLVAEVRGRAAIVPAETVLRDAERVRQDGYRAAGEIGVDVRPLTTAVANAIGAASGVVVAWVDPLGAAAGKVMVGDLIESIDDAPTPNADAWIARAGRLTPGDAIVLHARRQETALTIPLVATDRPENANVLGLAMRANRGVGAEIVAVGRGSAAERAGLQPGDLITMFGALTTPSPAEVTAAFNRAPEGASILAAITRAGRHDVVALARR